MSVDEESPKSGFYSVWAEPSHYDETLHSAMSQLRQQHEGPVFLPHVTVMGLHWSMQEDAVNNLKALCESTSPFTLKVEKVDKGNSFFQCVYLLMDKTDEVVDTHLRALRCFNLKEDISIEETIGKYKPHMSLLYCHLPVEALSVAKAKVEAEHGKMLAGKEFTISHLSLWITDLKDESCVSWKKVAAFPLRA